MKHLFFHGLGLIVLISFLTFSCQNEADRSELVTTDQSFSPAQFQEFFQKINNQYTEKNKDGKNLSARGIIPPTTSSACQPEPPAPNLSCATAHIIRTVNLPPNVTCPACTTAVVGFTVRVCYDPSLPVPNYSFNFYNFGLIALGAACENCLFSLPGHGGDVVLDQMSYHASLIIEYEYVDDWVYTWRPPCSNNAYYSSDFLRETCYRWCINFSTFEISQITCGEKCCKRTRQFCWEPLPIPNGTISTTQPVFETVGASSCGIITLTCNGLQLNCEDRPCGTIP